MCDRNVRSAWRGILGLVLVAAAALVARAENDTRTTTASGTAAGTSTEGVLDGDRFSTEPGSLWKGDRAKNVYWQVTFAEPRPIGAILQINGDNSLVLSNAPRNYCWQASLDGQTWQTIRETVVQHEKRMYRIHRLRQPVEARHLRVFVNLSTGDAPALREVELYADTGATIEFEDWIVGVSSAEEPENTAAAKPFVSLARLCEGWETVPAQCLWHGDFDEAFVAVEPRPLCAFLSGSFLEWCQCSREPWRGVQEVLKSRRLPMWGACGGAQILAILEESGVDQPWDCPRCRNPKSPLLPVYTHIGHKAQTPCGDYSGNLSERGLYQMQIETRNAAFDGVPDVFEIMESHVGQIGYVPKGWVRLVTRGPGAYTVNQCLRVADVPIYAAQFHMEIYDKTQDVSTRIMSNFLREAKAWGRYKPAAQPPTSEEPAQPVPAGESRK
jgi:hypothetical protein